MFLTTLFQGRNPSVEWQQNYPEENSHSMTIIFSTLMITTSLIFFYCLQRNQPSIEKKKENFLRTIADGNRGQVLKCLDEGMDVNTSDILGQTTLHYAAFHSGISIMKLLLERKININCQDKKGWTVLHNASDKGQIQVVQFLLKNNAFLEVRNEHGETPLHVAANHGQLDVLKILLNHGAELEAKDNHGWTAFFKAVINGRENLVKFLGDEKKANIRILDENMNTALHIAVKIEAKKIAQYLLKKGLDKAQKNINGKTPLNLAMACQDKKIIQLLEKRQKGKIFQLCTQ